MGGDEFPWYGDLMADTKIDLDALVTEHDIFHICANKWTPGGGCETYILARRLQRVEELATKWETSAARPIRNPALDWEVVHASQLRERLRD